MRNVTEVREIFAHFSKRLHSLGCCCSCSCSRYICVGVGGGGWRLLLAAGVLWMAAPLPPPPPPAQLYDILMMSTFMTVGLKILQCFDSWPFGN